MSLEKITASPTVPELLNFLNSSVDEFGKKLDTTATAADSSKLGGTAAASYAKLASPAFTGTPTVPTAATGTKTTQAASTAFVQTEIANKVNQVVPIGTIIAFAANSAPTGYILCNGANVSRTTYSNLFAVIGTLYGAGDGSTTFTLPNLTDRFIEGSSTAGNKKSAGLPNITGTGYDGISASDVATYRKIANGAFSLCEARTTQVTAWAGGGTYYDGSLDFDASRSNAIYGKSNTVQPASLTARFYIKF